MSIFLDSFVPHHGNNHKAGLAKSSSLFFLTLFFIGMQVFLNFFLLARPSVLGFSSNISPERIIELTNIERAKKGLSPLKENKILSEAARQKAADMFAFNYWAHISPSGRSPWTFFTDAGYKYQYAGENLARDFSDPESVVNAWMNSPSHRENIVNSKYEEIGVAVVDGTLQGVETTLVVQHFGTLFGSVPKAKKPENKIPVVEKPSLQKATEGEVVSKEVISGNDSQLSPLASPLSLSKGIVIFIVGILIFVFFIDIVLVSHRETPRFSSKSIAQMMFLLFVLLISFFIKKGVVL